MTSGTIVALCSILFVMSCTTETKTAETSDALIQQEIDSAEMFIMNEEIYSVVNQLLDELPGGFDSNIVVNRVLATTLQESGFYFTERTKLELELFVNRGKGVSSFLGTKDDSVFIEKQLKATENKYWIPGKYRGISENDELLSRYELNESFDWDQFKKDGFGCFESYGVPLFNVDSTRCVLEISGVCHGSLGFSSTLLFEQKQGKWKYVGERQGWIS